MTIALMVVIELVALSILVYLLWYALAGDGANVAGCGGEGEIDCDRVLTSPWSKWLNLPVALPALVIYVGLLAVTLAAGPYSSVAVRRWAWRLLVALTTVAAGAALWFILLQLVWVEAICLYCMSAHACGLVLFGIALATAPRAWRATHHPPASVILLGGPAGSRPAGSDRGEESVRQDHVSYGSAVLAGACVVGLFIALQIITVPHSYTVASENDLLDVASAGDIPTGHRKQPGGISKRVDRPAPDEKNPPPDHPRKPTHASDTPAATTSADTPPRRRLADAEPGAGNATVGPAQTQANRLARSQEAPGLADQRTDASAHARPHPDAKRSSRSAPTLELLGGKVTLRLDQQLLLAPPTADRFLVLFFDYTCPHCRKLCRQVRTAQEQFGGRLGVVLIPVPLNAGCNSNVKKTYPRHDFACQYARLALAVSKHNRAAFPQFHDWLLESKNPPAPGIAGSRAETLIPDQSLLEATLDSWVDDRLQECIRLYERYGAGKIPKIAIGGHVITGDVESQKELLDLIQEFLGMVPAKSGASARAP